jgi:hypothetical protein
MWREIRLRDTLQRLLEQWENNKMIGKNRFLHYAPEYVDKNKYF